MNSRNTFFDEEGDLRMERQNVPAWKALVGHVLKAAEFLPHPRKWDVLDLGCHTGGLLEIIRCSSLRERIRSYMGVEPIDRARGQARARIGKNALFYKDFSEVPDQSVDVLVSHEALYLMDLEEFIAELRRVLRPDGGAFIALGSHDENPTWVRHWRAKFNEEYGHITHNHVPQVILKSGDAQGFNMEYSRLWPGGYPEPRRYHESDPGTFKSVREALEFSEYKYLFIFYPRR